MGHGIISKFQLTPSATDQLEDTVDVVHTGIIKALNASDAGSFVAHGMIVTQSSGVYTVTNGGYFTKGEYKVVGF